MKPSILATLASALLLASSAQASTLTWNTDGDSLLFNVNGGLLDSSFTFELGTFGTTFVPTASNYNDWLTNWKRFDRASVSAGGSFNPGNGTVSSIASVLDGADPADHTDNISSSAYADPTATFAEGERAYIFVYNNLSPTPGTEWALYTNPTWLLPRSSSHSSVTLDWNINTQGQAVLGGSQNSYTSGIRYSNPVVYDVQTSTFPAAVPEPSGALLIGSIGMVGMLRRRRR
jgi:hypothetical protein